ncbi:hypothetical protein CBF23_003355 [Marinomonas agarivorans]|nr:hypothetical protein CBF23_003355 [Marinomonas agarivorans]
MRKFPVFLMFVFMLSACGNKGALYLPTERTDLAHHLAVTDLEDN